MPQPLSFAAVAEVFAGELNGIAADFNYRLPWLQRRWLLGNGPDREGFTSQQVVGLLCAGAVNPLVLCRPVCRHGETHALSEWLLDVFADLQ